MNNKTILIIDDEKMIHASLSRLMRNYGFHTLNAFTTAEATHLLKEHTPDIVLLDIFIPGSNTMALLQAIKSSARLQDTGLLVISGTTNMNAVASYIKAGADDYILKPFHPTLLRERIMHVMQRIERENTVKRSNSILTEASVKLQEIVAESAGVHAELAHEINNALTGVYTSSQLLSSYDEQSDAPVAPAGEGIL